MSPASFAEGLEAYLSDQMPGRNAILQGSARVLSLFDATTDQERILNTGMIEELDEMAGGTEEEITAEVELTPTPVPRPPPPPPSGWWSKRRRRILPRRAPPCPQR